MAGSIEDTEIFAHIGRKQIELENSRTAFASLTQEYSNLLLVLSNVLDGKIPAERVSVNLEARSWSIAPELAPSQAAQNLAETMAEVAAE